MNTPVLLLIFNRPDLTRRVFNSIRGVKPEELFIAADGPRNDKLGEKDLCNKTRMVTENITWPCNVKRLYRDINLGAGEGSADAISWFFKYVDHGIILEDDCLPNTYFFEFCSKMLETFSNDKTIMAISGDNFLDRKKWNENGYYISKYFCPPWGHATWSRAWKRYDGRLEDWPIMKKRIDRMFTSLWEKLYWHIHFNSIYKKHLNDIWDYQWQYAIWKNGGKCIVPGVNLVRNIGLDGSGTHINSSRKLLVPTSRINNNPKLMTKDFSREAENYYSKKIYRISPLMALAQWLYYNIFK